MKWTRFFIVASLIACSLVFAQPSTAHYQPGFHNQLHAINWGFCGKNNLQCKSGQEAKVVASLESGGFHWYGGHCTRAVNGQYRGCFQMGSWERATYGHGNDPWRQSRAASNYFRASGSDWSPWACKPWGVCYF